MENGLAYGNFTGTDLGVYDGDYAGNLNGLSNGIYNENTLYLDSTKLPIVRNGLVLHIDAAQAISYPRTGVVWRDLTNRNNNGTLTNGPTYNSDNGGSIVFNGSNNFVSFSDSHYPSGTNARSAQLWLRRSNDSSASILSWGKPDSGQMFAMGFVGATFYYSNYGSAFFDTGPLSTNTWHNLFASYSPINNTVQLYVNGILKTNTTSGTDNLVLDGLSYIGARRNGASPGATEYFNGRIAHVLIYAKALTASEVLQNYNATKSRFNL